MSRSEGCGCSVLCELLFKLALGIFPPLPFDRNSVDTTQKPPEPRMVTLKKSQVELGIQICGGNLYGIFVSDIEDDSPAKGPDGLALGDMILEVNWA